MKFKKKMIDLDEEWENKRRKLKALLAKRARYGKSMIKRQLLFDLSDK